MAMMSSISFKYLVSNARCDKTKERNDEVRPRERERERKFSKVSSWFLYWIEQIHVCNLIILFTHGNTYRATFYVQINMNLHAYSDYREINSICVCVWWFASFTYQFNFRSHSHYLFFFWSIYSQAVQLRQTENGEIFYSTEQHS